MLKREATKDQHDSEPSPKGGDEGAQNITEGDCGSAAESSAATN
jgi:hypothetical protein